MHSSFALFLSLSIILFILFCSTYNIVLVSGMQQRDSVLYLYIYIYIYSRLFSNIGYYKILSIFS